MLTEDEKWVLSFIEEIPQNCPYEWIYSSVEDELSEHELRSILKSLERKGYIKMKIVETWEGPSLELDLIRRASISKYAYIKRVPGHIGSDGTKREWCIFSHETNEMLQCYHTKKDAEKALKRMRYFKHKKSSIANDLVKIAEELIDEDFHKGIANSLHDIVRELDNVKVNIPDLKSSLQKLIEDFERHKPVSVIKDDLYKVYDVIEKYETRDPGLYDQIVSIVDLSELEEYLKWYY